MGKRLTFGIVLLLFASPALADVPIRAQRLATGLSKPLFITAAPGDPNRLYIAEQSGSGASTTAGIKILDLTTGTISPTRFLSIPNVATGNEQGLLGLAFHPNYAANGQFFVNLTVASTGQTQIRQYTRTDANTASTTFSTILSFDQPQSNHNGGWIGFGPNDGYLYIASGDGGNGNDEGTGHTVGSGNAQDNTNLLGKMLRIDVNGTEGSLNYRNPRNGVGLPSGNPFVDPLVGPPVAGRDEIWSYGLRNPWRASFDRKTGDLWIGDVGQGAWEEIDYQPANSTGGENYGWRAMEGLHPTGLTTVPNPKVDPVHEYANPPGSQAAVAGGYVYRGGENPALDGTYFFADNSMGKIWSLKYNGTTVSKFRELTGSLIMTNGGVINLPSSFGEDSQGHLYITDLDGELYRLIPAMPGDANLDNLVTAVDLGALAEHWQMGAGALWADGDFTDDGIVNILDLQQLALHWPTAPGALSLADALAAYGLPTNVPEPAGLLMLVPLAGLMMRRRGA